VISKLARLATTTSSSLILPGVALWWFPNAGMKNDSQSPVRVVQASGSQAIIPGRQTPPPVVSHKVARSRSARPRASRDFLTL
jgi:hypothetical protein